MGIHSDPWDKPFTKQIGVEKEDKSHVKSITLNNPVLKAKFWFRLANHDFECPTFTSVCRPLIQTAGYPNGPVVKINLRSCELLFAGSQIGDLRYAKIDFQEV